MAYWLIVGLCCVAASLGGNVMVLAAVLELAEKQEQKPRPPRGRLIPATMPA